MTMRGVAKPGSLTQSAAYTGEFSASRELRSDFAASVRSSPLSRQ
jgi:GTP cyclohydrolase I